MRLPALAKRIAVLFETSIHSLSHRSRSQRYVSRYRWTTLADGSWLRRPCGPRRKPTRLGGKRNACRWHKAWIGQGKVFHREPHQPACNDKWMWLSGRTLRTSDFLGRKIWTVASGKTHLLVPLHVTANCFRCALQVHCAWLPACKYNTRREIDQSYRKSVAYSSYRCLYRIVSVYWYVLMSH
jgi:hypothetical protein